MNNPWKAKAENLRTRIGLIDLPAAQRAVDQAEDEVKRIRATSAASPGYPEAANELRAAKTRLQNLLGERAQLARDLEQIEPRLIDEHTLQQAIDDEAAKLLTHGEKAAVRVACEAAVGRIDDTIAAEVQQVEAARKLASESILAAVKTGATDLKIAPASNEMLLALQDARAAANHELQDARRTEEAATSALSRAVERTRIVRCGVQEAEFLVVQDQYVSTLTELLVAKASAGIAYYPLNALATARGQAEQILKQRGLM